MSENTEEAAAPQESAEAEAGEKPSKQDLLVQEGDIAADYLEGLLDIADLGDDGAIDMDVEGDRAVVAVSGEGQIGRAHV